MDKIERITELSASSATATKIVVHKDESRSAFVYVFIDNSIRSTITTPKFDEMLGREDRMIASNSLVSECIKVAAEAGNEYIETIPSSHMPNLEDWISVLENNDFRLVAEKMIFVAESGDIPIELERTAKVVPSNLFQYEVLLEVFAQCQSQTLDRADKDELINVSTQFQELVDDDGSCNSSTFSWVAVVNFKPVGLVFIELEQDSAWIPYIGVIPSKRRQGIGKTLLLSAIYESQIRNKKLVKSLIDTNNLPSLKMHQRYGFHSSSGSYFVFQNVLRM